MSTDRQPRGVPVDGQFKGRLNPEATVLPEENPVNPPAWPAVAYEERRLDDGDAVTGSRRARMMARGPYLAAVTPEIADIKSVDVPPEVAAEAAEAAAEIARFDAEVGSEFANFSSILLRSESASSSEIEHLTAGAKAIALAEIGDTRTGKNATMIAANTAAMTMAIALADDLDEASIIAMHEALLGDSNPEWVGQWRHDQVRVGGSSVYDANFVAPHPDRVPAAMSDLVAFIQRYDIPTFEHAAVAHAQFETIHPFPDGNGRTGRALIHAMLRHQGLTRNVTVPVSAGLLSDTDAYFDALNQYRAGYTAPIVQLMASASFKAIANGRKLASDLEIVQSTWREHVKARSDSAVWRLLDVVVRQPAIDVALVQRELGIAHSNAENAIRGLNIAGVLSPASESKRNRVWIATDVIDALDEFAKRAKRSRPL